MIDLRIITDVGADSPIPEMDKAWVEQQLRRIYERLQERGVQVSRREELARFAIEHELPIGKRLFEEKDEDAPNDEDFFEVTQT